MKNKTLQRIHQCLTRIQSPHTSFIGRIFYTLAFFGLLFWYGVYTAAHVLFTPATSGFTALYDQSLNGTWNGSYAQYLSFQRGVRLFSATSLMTIVASVIVVVGALQFLFPTNSAEPSFAAKFRPASGTFTVTNTNDSGAGSFRQAITDANAESGSVEIRLNLAAGFSSSSVALGSTLPTLTRPVNFVQIGSTLLNIDGSALAAGTDCWQISSGATGSTIFGLAFQNCKGNAIEVTGGTDIDLGNVGTLNRIVVHGGDSDGIAFAASSSTIQNVHLGYHQTTNIPNGNGGYGITISGDSNTVTDISVVENDDGGIYVESTASGTTIADSTIGVSEDGYSTVNPGIGVTVYGDNTTITSVVAANNGVGIYVHDTADGTSITSSYIGTDASSTSTIGNSEDGIQIYGTDTVIGGDGFNRNIISGNQRYGILVNGAVNDATGTELLGNYIGLTVAGTGALGNANDGIYITGADDVTIGSSSATTQPVIAANDGYGLTVSSSSNITISEITVGMGTDDAAQGNEDGGVLISNSSSVTLQESDISHNLVNGVILGDVQNVTITGNTISEQTNSGIVATTTTDLTATQNTISSNGDYGVYLAVNTTDSTLGGTSSQKNTFDSNADGNVYLADETTKQIEITRNTFVGDVTPITLNEGANEGIATPSITDLDGTTMQGTGGAVGGRVEVYSDGAYVAETTTISSNGAWTLTADALSSAADTTLTALTIDTNSNTSAFSDAYGAVEPGTPTLSVTASSTFTDSIDVTITLSEAGTIYYTTDGSTPTISSESGTSPVALTVITTTTLKAFGVTQENETSAIITRTYTQSTDEPTENEDDLASYLIPENLTINTQPVFDTDTAVYVPFDTVQMVGHNAKNTHEVRVVIKDDEKSVVSAEWEEVNDHTWNHTVPVTLVRGDEYTVHGKVRVQEEPAITSELKKLSTIIASNAAPTIVSLKDAYTVTAKPQNLIFTGLYQSAAESATFIFQNRETGAIVDRCTVASTTTDGPTKSGACRLSTALPIGHYNVLFQSVQAYNGSDLPSAPAVTQLIVTRPFAVNVLNTDIRNPLYRNRITTSARNTVVGIGPEDSTARLFINGSRIGEATFTSAIGWNYPLDLSGYARGKNYLLEAKFFNESGKELRGTALSFPFRYASAVPTPVIPAGLRSTVVRNAVVNAGVVGGYSNLLTVKDNAHVVDTAVIDQDPNGPLANTTVILPTDDAGTHTIMLQAEDFTGLKSATSTYSYRVVVPQVTEQPTEEPTEEPEPPVEEPEEPVEEPTDTDIDDDGIPNEWDTIITDPAQITEVKERLQTQNKTNLKVVGKTEEVDDSGNITTARPAQQNSLGETILHRRSTLGFQPLSTDIFTQEVERDVVTFSGVSDPYAVVTLILRSDPLVQFTRADAEGKWTLTVPVDAIPPGEHTASLYTQSNGVKSDEIQIAKFVVLEEKHISNTTWIFLINMGIALLVLFLAFALQIRSHRKKLDRYLPPPVAMTPIQSPQTDATSEQQTVQSMTAAAEQKEKPDNHSALDI